MGDSAIRERLESHDPAARVFSYSIVEGPMPVENYLATVSVEPLDGDRSRVVWDVTFESTAPEDAIASGLESAYGGALAAVAKVLAG